MDDIGVSNDDTISGFSLRRPSRAERAIDDPIREMEGMLVDEYGRSENTLNHLNQIIIMIVNIISTMLLLKFGFGLVSDIFETKSTYQFDFQTKLKLFVFQTKPNRSLLI